METRDKDVNPKAKSLSFEDLTIGAEFSHQYTITDEIYEAFLNLFGDRSPLHTSDEAAISCGFDRRLVHGATLNGLISNFVGMQFPGRKSLELGVSIDYARAVYIGDVLSLRASVTERFVARSVVTMKIVFTRDGQCVARAKVRIMICDVD
jgi:3-hydroxybutyryl-CoA dehydratase